MADACPLCGEPLAEESVRCDNCGAEFPVGKHEEVRALGDALRDLAVSSAEECPACGEPRPGDAASCPACGHAYVPGAPVPAPPTLTHEEEQWLKELEFAIAGEEGAPPPPLEAEVPEGVVEEKRALFDFLRAIPGVGRTAAQNVAVLYLNAEHLAMAEVEDLAAVPDVTREEARRIKEAADRFAATRPKAPPARAKPARAAPPPPPLKAVARPKVPVTPTAKGKAPPARPPRFMAFREIAAVTTVVGVPAIAAAAYAAVPGYDWGLLFLFGVLFGVAAVVTLPDLRGLPRARLPLLASALGTLLLAVPPLAAYVASPLDAVPGVALLALGAALLAASAWILRAGPGLFLPWVAGLLLLTLLAFGPLALVSPGAEVATVGNLVGAVLALGVAALVVLRRASRFLADARLLRADQSFAGREYAKALGLYEDAAAWASRAGRESDAAWYGRGSVLVALGRFDESLRCFDRALALNPRNEVAWVNRGTALTRLGDTHEALRCYNAAIKTNPKYEVAWNNKGNALARLGRHDWALRCYERALDLDPAYRTAWVNKGFVLTKLGRFEEAAVCADTALRLTTGAPAAS